MSPDFGRESCQLVHARLDGSRYKSKREPFLSSHVRDLLQHPGGHH